MMKNIVIIIILTLVSFSCEKLEYEIPVQIVNMDCSSYSKVFEKAIKNKLSRRNFQIVDYGALYVLTINDFYFDEWDKYETVYDDCTSNGAVEYELHVEEVRGTVTFREGNEIIESWEIQASESESLSEGKPLLVEILSSDDDCEEYGDCPDCTDYHVSSPGVFNIKNRLKNSARKIAKDMVDILSYR